MKSIVAMIDDIAAEIRADVKVVVKEADDVQRDAISRSVESLLGRVRKNEGLETFFHRQDDDGRMVLLMAVSDHEAKKAILKALKRNAEKVGGKIGVSVWTKEAGDMRVYRQLRMVSRELEDVYESE